MVGSVCVRIVDQVGALRVNVDATYAVGDRPGVGDGTGNIAFKHTQATRTAVVADTRGEPHIHVIFGPNAKLSIIQTGSLNIFPSTWYYGRHVERINDPINHSTAAKTILFVAYDPGHRMGQVIGSILGNTGYDIINIRIDSTGVLVSCIEPTTAQQSTAVENGYQRNAIADVLCNEPKFSEWEGHGQTRRGVMLRKLVVETQPIFYHSCNHYSVKQYIK